MSDYKYVIPATEENIEFRLEFVGIAAATRMLELEMAERVALKLFLRYGFCLITDHSNGVRKITAARSIPKNLKLSP